MKLFDRFRSKHTRQAATGITDLAKTIGPLLDNLANDIFLSHREILLSEPITYIVPAVWGAAKDAELTAEQIEINKKIVPVVNRVFQILQIDNLNESQAFAIGFIVRGLIISKVTYMIEALKNKLMSMEADRKDYLIRNMEPMGHA